MDISPNKKSTVYVSIAGPTDNIGDALIRRHSLAWARGESSEPIGVYGGKASNEWLELMGVRGSDNVIRRRSEWVRAIIQSPRKATYFFEPGELRLGRHMLAKEVVGLSIATWIRLRGGQVVRPPRAVSNPNPIVLGIHKLSAALSQVNMWRQEESRTTVGRGQTVPDIAFWEAPYGRLKDIQRSLIVVSLRGNRLDPGEAFVAAVRRLGAVEKLDVVTSAQVEEDEDRAKHLALRMDGNRLNWASTHHEQELALRSLYENARLVISDRLHVLVLAALGGAVPVEAVPEPSGKIESHFATVGIDNISHDITSMSEQEIFSILQNALHSGRSIDTELVNARNILVDQVSSIHDGQI